MKLPRGGIAKLKAIAWCKKHACYEVTSNKVKISNGPLGQTMSYDAIRHSSFLETVRFPDRARTVRYNCSCICGEKQSFNGLS